MQRDVGEWFIYVKKKKHLLKTSIEEAHEIEYLLRRLFFLLDSANPDGLLIGNVSSSVGGCCSKCCSHLLDGCRRA